MVMKKNAMHTNLRRSIRKSLGRYIAIAMIIALGAGMFVGLRITKTDMVATGQKYMDEQNMFDLRLVTSYGWGREQLAEIEKLDGIADAEGLFYTDLIAQVGQADGDNSVFRFYTIPQKINRLVLLGGRMPENPNECLADGFRNDERILGTQVTISEENSENALDALTEKTFTVVGYVSTPLYMDMDRGNTSVGSGRIENYFFVPDEAFDADYYTEIHLTVPEEYAVYSDEYSDAMKAMADTLEPLLAPMAQERLIQERENAKAAYAEGKEKYQDGMLEYLDGKHKAEKELADALRKLQDGEAELAENEQMLTDGEQQVADGKITIADSRKTLEESRKTLADAKAGAYRQTADAHESLFENYQTVSRNLREVNNGLLQITAGMIQLNSGITQLESGLTQLDAGIEQLEMLIGIVDTGIDAANRALDYALQEEIVDEETVAQLRAKLEEYAQKRSEYAAQLADLKAQRTEYAAQLEDLYRRRAELESQQAVLEGNKQTLESAMQSIEEGYHQLASQQAMMEKKFAAADAQIAAGRVQLDEYETTLTEKEQEIADGWIALAEGRQEIQDGWEDYRQGKADAETELADAEAELADAKIKLDDARKTIANMKENKAHVLDRGSNLGYSSLRSSSDIVWGVSRVFPAFFLLVAALVCITTMTRMVDEERTQIGTLKAMGYSSGDIIRKYLFYAGSSALLGCGLGVLAGSVVFPVILWEAYKIMLFVTDSIVLTFDWKMCLTVVAAYTAVELGVTWYCCRKTLQEVPAELIRPKPPTDGKPLIFEKMRLWKKVSFLNKVTVRNIFRYHQRLAMMLVGIGGCTALLLTGFGLKDSIVNIVDFQFQDVTAYDMSVYFSEGQTPQQQTAFLEKISSDTADAMFYYQTGADVICDGESRSLFLISATEDLQRFIDLHDGSRKLSMPELNEVLLSVGAAEHLGIHAGDKIQLQNADMQFLDVTVTGIYDNFVQNYAIVTPETIEAQWGSLPEMQMAFVDAAQGKDVHQVTAKIAAMENVMNVAVSEDMAEMVAGMMKALNLVVVVVVFCAGLLAATVLYNLTNININERIREIATIKVLGFNATETALYIFKENLVLSAMGTALGLLLGKLLLVFVMSQIKIDFVWFLPRALPLSYVWSVVLTLLTACIVDLIFYYKLEKINMAEALKSVE